jgi:polyferredoxin
MDYPRGLVRYTTEHELSGGRTHWLRGRSVGYGTVLTIMILAFSVAVITRSAFEVDVIRERGALFQLDTSGQVVNQYSLRVLNKTQGPQAYDLKLASDLPVSAASTAQLTAALESLPGELVDLPLTLTVAREAVALPSTPVIVELCERTSGRCVSEQTTFFGPTR